MWLWKDCAYEPKTQETTALYYEEDLDLVTSGLFVKLRKVVRMKGNAVIIAMLKLIWERWHSSHDCFLEDLIPTRLPNPELRLPMKADYFFLPNLCRDGKGYKEQAALGISNSSSKALKKSGKLQLTQKSWGESPKPGLSAALPSCEIEERVKQGHSTGAGDSFSTTSLLGRLLRPWNWKSQDRNHIGHGSESMSTIQPCIFYLPLIWRFWCLTSCR